MLNVYIWINALGKSLIMKSSPGSKNRCNSTTFF